MRVLLDTHAMFWYVEGDVKLSVTAQTLIQNLSNESSSVRPRTGKLRSK